MSVILELTRIVQAAAEAESPAAQVSVIVDSIQHYMNLDVCSLYLADERGDMALLAVCAFQLARGWSGWWRNRDTL